MKKIVLFALLTVALVSALVIGTSAAAYNEETDVAKIGTEGYATLIEAVQAAKDDDVIELTKDVTNGDGVIVPSGKNFTLDFGGHTYTVTQNAAGSKGTQNQCFQLLKGSTLVFKNGTIKAGTTSVWMMVQNYADLTLTDMVLDGTSITAPYTGLYTLSNNCGDVVINGSTSIISRGKTGDVAFDVCYWPTKADGKPTGYDRAHSVTINTTGKIVGTVIIGSEETDKIDPTTSKNGVSLILNKGTIDGNIKIETTKTPGELTVNGGSVTGKLTVAETTVEGVSNDVAIKGGVFNDESFIEHVEGDKTYEKIGDKYVIRSNSTTDRANHAHRFNKTWTTTSNMHWKGCACGEIMMKGPHSFGAAMTNIEGNTVYACKVCGFEKAA